MIMEILKLTGENFQAILKKTAGLIKDGKVVVAPTDTVYGLLADATNASAVKKVFEIKLRDLSKPLPLFIQNLDDAKKIARITKTEETILKNSWPGKFTFVLEKKNSVKVFGVAKDSIALRIPNNAFVLKLLEMVNRPLTGTSANLAGKAASTAISAVLEQFESVIRLDLIVDAGNLPESKPSSIVDLRNKTEKILR